MKIKEQELARKLRMQGLAIREIAKQLKVSKSSISNWVRDIILTEEQIQELKQKNPIYNNQIHGAKTIAKQARNKRREYQQSGKDLAKKGELLHQAGCILYWAEGAKTKNYINFTNSDLNMNKMFLSFIRKYFNVPNNKISIKINCYTNNGLSKTDIENYWLIELSLDESCLRKTQENKHPRSATNTIRHNKLLYGICTICIYSTEIVQHIYGAIQEYSGFNNDYMLM